MLAFVDHRHDERRAGLFEEEAEPLKNLSLKLRLVLDAYKWPCALAYRIGVEDDRVMPEQSKFQVGEQQKFMSAIVAPWIKGDRHRKAGALVVDVDQPGIAGLINVCYMFCRHSRSE